MELSEFIKPLGIVTYGFVFLTFMAGLLRARLKLKIKLHKTLAFVAVILASVHGLLVLIFY